MSNKSSTSTASKASDKPVLTPLLQQYVDLKQQNPDAILLFRCGDFYETFFEDAVLASAQLQITLTARGKSAGKPVPMAGVPHHSVDGYIAKLVQKGFTVAICEQMEDPKTAKGLVKRDVVRIITPGTISDPQMLDETSNNYLVALGRKSERFCLAAVEISTGEMIVCNGDKSESQHLPEELTRLMPREILVLSGKDEQETAPPWNHLNAGVHHNNISEREAIDALTSVYPDEQRSRFLAMPPLMLKTLGILAFHLLDTQRCSLKHLQLPKEYGLGDGMVLDESTLRNLELLPDRNNPGLGGNLFDVINRCRSSMGARMLKRWLLKPLIQLDPIIERQNLVEAFHQDALLLAEIREQLKGIPDIERLLSKIVLSSRNPRDLQALANGLDRVAPIKTFLADKEINALADKLNPIEDLSATLAQFLDDELPANINEGGFVREGVNPDLDELRSLLRDGNLWLKKFEEQEKQKTGIKTLKVKKNNVFGYFIEISKSFVDQAPDNYVRKQTLTSGERYITAELKDYENKIFSASDKMIAIEKDVFACLVEQILNQSPAIQHNARALSEVDALSSLAQLAHDKQYTKPSMHDSSHIKIEGGRHPVVEVFLERGDFHPNDLLLNDSRKQAIITGPNMAGKSTYLRQTALIVLLAQMGSFVPAANAELGIVDRIFTRVGASDNLILGQSTFMVEMMEASAILKNATSRSLLILDEIGRGTSTFDGLSLAWSILEHISLNLSARTLFATHYHELTELESIHPGVFNLNITVNHDEKTGKMVFLHRIDEGSASKSYGIEVARLAGLPGNVIDRAKEILFELEKTEQEELGRLTRASRPSGRPQQLSLFSPGNELVDTLHKIDLNNTTPFEALGLLNRLKEMANDR